MAISRASYSAGNRVYRGSSSAPTTGPVDKMGYIEREMNKPVANFAAAAQVKLKTPTPAPVTKAVAVKGALSGVKTTPTGAVLPAPNGAVPVSVTNPGTQNPDTTGTALPLGSDQYLPQQQADLSAQHSTNLLNYQNQQDQENLNYATTQRNDNLAQPQAQASLLNNAAARGLAQSSGYGYSVGQQQDAFQRQLSDLDAQHNSTLNGITTGINTENQNYNNQLTGYQTAAGNRLAAQAGTLGLDGSTTPVQTTQQYLSQMPQPDPNAAAYSAALGNLQQALGHPVSASYLKDITHHAQDEASIIGIGGTAAGAQALAAKLGINQPKKGK